MKCPYCGSRKDRVIDSRSSNVGQNVRRRRECLKCERRFTTYEYIEEIPLMVIKKDGRREPFDRKKLLVGIMKGDFTSESYSVLCIAAMFSVMFTAGLSPYGQWLMMRFSRQLGLPRRRGYK